MPRKMPVLFVGHGSPLNIVLDNSFTRAVAEWGKRLPRPKAIMVISAHWLTSGTFVSCVNKPRTIHDFYGFPKELYELDYPSPGAPEEANMAIEAARTVIVQCDTAWGLDHASWSVLRHLFPAADIPVFEMSLDYSFNDWYPKPIEYHYDLAADLGELRERGILIVGSGNIVHNLKLIDFEDMDAKVYQWAREFDEEVKNHLLQRNHRDLIHYRKNGKAADLSVPTLDHYLPMIYTAALREQDESLTFVYEGFQNASISMRCFQIG